jgi:hypothetical protein
MEVVPNSMISLAPNPMQLLPLFLIALRIIFVWFFHITLHVRDFFTEISFHYRMHALGSDIDHSFHAKAGAN